jgi:hypothetical protein
MLPIALGTLLWLLGSAGATASSAQASMPITAPTSSSVRQIDDAETVLAVHVRSGGLSTGSFDRLIVAAWADGTVIWSDDRVSGGPPYRRAQIPAARVIDTIQYLSDRGIFEVESLQGIVAPPDARYTAVIVHHDGKRMLMGSSHELLERHGSVATEGAHTGLDGERLYARLEREPSTWLFRRMIFAEIQRVAWALVPTAGEPIDGCMTFEQGKAIWLQPNQCDEHGLRIP